MQLACFTFEEESLEATASIDAPESETSVYMRLKRRLRVIERTLPKLERNGTQFK